MSCQSRSVSVERRTQREVGGRGEACSIWSTDFLVWQKHEQQEKGREGGSFVSVCLSVFIVCHLCLFVDVSVFVSLCVCICVCALVCALNALGNKSGSPLTQKIS